MHAIAMASIASSHEQNPPREKINKQSQDIRRLDNTDRHSAANFGKISTTKSSAFPSSGVKKKSFFSLPTLGYHSPPAYCPLFPTCFLRVRNHLTKKTSLVLAARYGRCGWSNIFCVKDSEFNANPISEGKKSGRGRTDISKGKEIGALDGGTWCSLDRYLAAHGISKIVTQRR